MPLFVLEPIKADTRLAALFNAYMHGLSTLAIFSTPRESMHECRVAFALEAKGKKRKISIVDQAQRYYKLTVLGTSLRSLYWCIEQAHALLTRFYTEHGGDLTAYAVANRRETLSEYGGGEDADWYHTGTGNPDAGEGWEVTDTTDPTRLAEYGLHESLAIYFANKESHGDYIGTSAPIDFHQFTVMVEHQTDFAPHKMFAAVAGQALPTYQLNENGEMIPLSVIDQIEHEINEDIANERLTTYFNALLNACQYSAELYAAIQPNESIGYRLLYQCLNSMLEVQLDAYPPF